MQFGLSTATLQTIQSVFECNPKIESAVIYGSRAKGNFKAGSDIDIVLFGKNLELSDLFEIETRLSDTFLPYTFDLSIHHHHKNKELLEHIDTVGKLFYKKMKINLT
jgi:predicted nucleotidyltransferase